MRSPPALLLVLLALLVPAATPAQAKGPSVSRALADLVAAGRLTPELRQNALDRIAAARSALRRQRGRRRAELKAPLDNLTKVAAAGMLAPDRLAQLLLTVDRNRQHWAGGGALLGAGATRTFSGSEIVWRSYPGEGLQIQQAENWDKVLQLHAKARTERRDALLNELLSLGVDRGGALGFEYHFDFGGGAPPWVSSLSQGIAVQALVRVATRGGRPELLDVARRAALIFELPAPTGVRLDAGLGRHYLIYSFAPGLRVLNAFARGVAGLFDLAQADPGGFAPALFAAGDARLREELPSYDTGAWSRYSTVREAPIVYQRLNIEFLDMLCRRTTTPEYCTTRDRFSSYLRQPPVMSVVPDQRIRGGVPGRVELVLSKIGRLAVTIRDPRGTIVLSRVLPQVAGGSVKLRWPKVSRTAGAYTVSLESTDLAGNRGSGQGMVKVLKPRRKRSM